MKNLAILVADSLRYDYLPESIKEKGSVVKTLTQATYTPASFASLVLGLSPENHSVRWFFDSVDFSKPNIFDYFDNSCFFDHPNDPLSKIVFKRWASNLELKAIPERFVWIERLMDTHTPYGQIKHGNEIPAHLTHSPDRTRIGDPAEYFNVAKEYERGVKSLEDHFWHHMTELKERRILDDTLVVLTSDHGEILRERVRLGKDVGHSWPICRELVEVPTVFLNNYEIKAQCMRSIDIVPTCLDLLGISFPPDTFDGRSIMRSEVSEGVVIGWFNKLGGKYYYISKWKFNERKGSFEPKRLERVRLLTKDTNRYFTRLIAAVFRHLPDWSKPTLRRMLAVYKDTKLTLRKTRRRLHSPAPPKNINGKVYIHLGCGRINAPGFINVDAVAYPHVHYIQEVNDLSRFPNKYADLIYASHVLEHISHRHLSKVLSEWRRVLKGGGILRISLPDFDKLIEVYLSEDEDIRAIMMPLMGGQDYSHNFHKTVFNRKYLTELLLSVGFRVVREWDPGKVELHAFEDWAARPIERRGKKYPVSLNLEAVK